MKYISISIITLLLLAGCNQAQALIPKKSQFVQKKPLPKKVKSVRPTKVKKVKKNIKLKKVEDRNYSSAYMYPESTNKKEEVEKPIPATVTSSNNMNKEECIAMISQEKFDKYTRMFGSEAASIKRCNMIKAMNH